MDNGNENGKYETGRIVHVKKGGAVGGEWGETVIVRGGGGKELEVEEEEEEEEEGGGGL